MGQGGTQWLRRMPTQCPDIQTIPVYEASVAFLPADGRDAGIGQRGHSHAVEHDPSVEARRRRTSNRNSVSARLVFIVWELTGFIRRGQPDIRIGSKNLSATAREITAAKVAPCWYEPQRYRDAPMAERGSPIATVNVQDNDATHNRFEASHPYPPMVERRFANYPSTMGTASS